MHLVQRKVQYCAHTPLVYSGLSKKGVGLLHTQLCIHFISSVHTQHLQCTYTFGVSAKKMHEKAHFSDALYNALRAKKVNAQSSEVHIHNTPLHDARTSSMYVQRCIVYVQRRVFQSSCTLRFHSFLAYSLWVWYLIV